jgi:methyl-accepting chemotaxis protein
MRAADAAKNTAELIEGTVKKINTGSKLVSTTGDEFTKIAESSSKVGELVAEISEASKEQANGIEQVYIAFTVMVKVVEQNAANAEESSSASEQMNAQAEQLKEYVGDLVVLVTGKREGKTKIPSQKSARTNVTKNEHVPVSGRKRLPQSKEIRPDQVIPFDDDENLKDF